MRSLSTIVTVLYLTLITISTQAQDFANKELGLGQWRLHAQFNNGLQVAKAGNKIYCASKTGFYYLDTDDNTLHIVGTEDGLSSNQINLIRYSKDAKTLVVVHTNFNIDLIRDGKIYTISEIRTKASIGLKNINDVYINGKYAYLSCGFGVVKINLAKQEIADTYYLAPQGQSKPINGFALFNNYFYATTDKGIYKCLANSPAISDYRTWSLDSMNNNSFLYKKKYKQITACNNQLVVNNYSAAYAQDTIYVYNTSKQWVKTVNLNNLDVSDINYVNDEIVVTNFYTSFVLNPNNLNLLRYGIVQPNGEYYSQQVITDDADGYYMADSKKGIVHCNKFFGGIASYSPSSAYFASGFRMNFIDSTLYVSGGGYDKSGFPKYSLIGVQMYKNFDWKYIFTGNKDIIFNTYVGDITSCNIDAKNKNRSYFTSWGGGLIEAKDSAGTLMGKQWNHTNSALQSQPGNFGFVAINNTVFDKNNNLWMDNTYGAKALVVKTADNNWKAFNVGLQGRTRQLLVSRNGNKWLAIAREGGIAVFNDNNTPLDESDDVYRVLNTNELSGGLHTLEINSITEDANGDIWVGTLKGVTVFYNADNVLAKSGANFEPYKAQQIKVNVTGNVEYLLETESILSIVVDNANRKWIATENSGVYLVSENGTEQIKHFDINNSPLITNEIKSIAINSLNGEVFFGHDFGIQSYKAEATQGSTTCKDIYGYPNPVRADYSGEIAVKNVYNKSQIKITDFNGNLVTQLTSLGGQALWDGKNSNGEKVPSGIYIVLVANETTGKTCKTKIMIID
jgi:streptogramin lyase